MELAARTLGFMLDCDNRSYAGGGRLRQMAAGSQPGVLRGFQGSNSFLKFSSLIWYASYMIWGFSSAASSGGTYLEVHTRSGGKIF